MLAKDSPRGAREREVLVAWVHTRAKGGTVFRYIREHWLVYLIGLVVAVALGLGAAYVVGVVGSTPSSVREERIESEEEREDQMNSIDEDLNALSSDGSDATADDAATTDAGTDGIADGSADAASDADTSTSE